VVFVRPKWPSASLSFSASKGLVPPSSPSMSQGGPCLGSPGAVSYRTSGVPSCAANTPARSIFCGAHCGPHLCSHEPSRGGSGSASSTCLRMPVDWASCGGVLDPPESFCGGSGDGGGDVSSTHHTTLSAFGSNASGLATVVSTAPLAGSTLAVPSVGAGAVCASGGAHAGSCASTLTRSTASAPAFSAA
jgi:hypothetical protein